jgi:hypothetical protein
MHTIPLNQGYVLDPESWLYPSLAEEGGDGQEAFLAYSPQVEAEAGLGMLPRATRSGLPARPLDTPATFVVDAAHNGFTVEEAYALFLEKRALQGYRLRARIAPPKAPGDWSPKHWNEAWTVAWTAMEGWQATLAAVRTPEAWHAYMAEAPRSSSMYQRWVAMDKISHGDQPTMERACTRTLDGAPRSSWARLAQVVRDDREPYFDRIERAMPQRWTETVADRLLARWMRRVGLQVLQWPWSAGQSAALKWTVFCQLRRCQQTLVRATGWRGPVLGLGGPLWWRMGVAAPTSASAATGMADPQLGVPLLDTGGMAWFSAFYHEWLHTLERLLTESATLRSTGRFNRGGSGLGLHCQEDLISAPRWRWKRPSGALRRAHGAVHTLIEDLKRLAPVTAPRDWADLRARYDARYNRPLNPLPEGSGYWMGDGPWTSPRTTAATWRFWSDDRPWKHAVDGTGPVRFQTLFRSEPCPEPRHEKSIVDCACYYYQRTLIYRDPAPGWFERMAGQAAMELVWGHRQRRNDFTQGESEPVWWTDPAEHMAIAFERDIATTEGLRSLPDAFDDMPMALYPTPMECTAMRPAWDRFFRTLDPIWRRMVRWRYRAWQHHPFPMPVEWN